MISANNYGTQTVGSQIIGGQGHTNTTNFSIQNGSADITQILEKFQEIIQKSNAPVEEKQDLTDEVNSIGRRAQKRGNEWAFRALELVAKAALPVMGEEGASLLMALLPAA